MHACEIMTNKVVTVPPDMSVQEIAGVMVRTRVSGLPVVAADGRVLGIVSEADLLKRTEMGADEMPARWPAMLAQSGEFARSFVKTHGAQAHDVMARPVVSVQYDADVSTVADTLARHGIKRVPVMKEGLLVGIIARSDIVRAFGESKESAASGVHLGDGVIRKTITDTMRGKPWLDTSYLNISVNDGVVSLSGYVQSSDHSEAVRVLIEEVPGVQRVEQDLKIGMPTLTWDGRQLRDQILT